MATALIAEDDADIADLLALYLSSDGFEVMIAPDGYIAKPFDPLEVVALAKALLRRYEQTAASVNAEQRTTITIAGLLWRGVCAPGRRFLAEKSSGEWFVVANLGGIGGKGGWNGHLNC